MAAVADQESGDRAGAEHRPHELVVRDGFVGEALSVAVHGDHAGLATIGDGVWIMAGVPSARTKRDTGAQ